MEDVFGNIASIPINGGIELLGEPLCLITVALCLIATVKVS